MTEVTTKTNVIGSQDEAEIAATLSWKLRHEIPPSWRYLDSGSYREVFVSSTGVVYKVHVSGSRGNEMQRDEVRIFHRYADHGWSPLISLWTVTRKKDNVYVVAMPLYEGDGTSLNDAGYDDLDEMRRVLDDMTSNNYVIVQGRPIAIDGGGNSR